MRGGFVALPKAEVHVHLEGGFDIDDIIGLARQNGVALPRPREHLFDFGGGLGTFLEFLDFVCGLVRTPEQLAALARRFSERLAANGTGYADLIVNPTHWRHWSRRIPELIDALDAGFKSAEQDGLPSAALCISLLRTQSADEAIELVELLAALRHPRIVALSIDGNEATAGRTGPRFADAFRRAGAAGLKRTVHAGESSGPEGVRDAVELLDADRIDHGVRAIDDPAVVELLVERRIPLGVCPSSNVTLGLYPTLAAHPIDRLRRAGVPVSINTDDPALLGVTLAGEYESCTKVFDWSADDVRAIARTSIEASFAPTATKRHLLAELAAW
jgi:adenosine deaminase